MWIKCALRQHPVADGFGLYQSLCDTLAQASLPSLRDFNLHIHSPKNPHTHKKKPSRVFIEMAFCKLNALSGNILLPMDLDYTNPRATRWLRHPCLRSEILICISIHLKIPTHIKKSHPDFSSKWLSAN